MSDPVLSIEELRRWGLARTKKGQLSGLRVYDRELPLHGLMRHLGWNNIAFYQWLKGKRTLRRSEHRALSRFVTSWERGLLEFTTPGKGKRRALVHRDTPRPMPVRMRIDLSSGVPRLSLIAKPKPLERMPAFRKGVLDILSK